MKSNQRLWAFLAIFLCLAAMVMTGSYYVTSVREDAMGQAINSVLLMTQQQETAFSNFVRLDRERVHSLAEYFTSCRSDDTDAFASKMRAVDKVGAVYTVINKRTGLYYTNKSDTTAYMKKEELADHQNLTGSGIRNIFTGLYTNRPMFGYYECFLFADGVEGIFQKAYESTQLNEEFALSFYNGHGFAFVINGQGDVLLRSAGSEELYDFENIFESIDFVDENVENKETFVQALGMDQTGVEIFYDKDDARDYVYAYTPVTVAEGWYIVSIIPLDDIMEEANEIIGNSQAAFLVVFIVLGFILIAVLFMWQIQRNLERKEQEIAYQEEQFNILIDFLGRTTDDIYIMMDKDTFRVEHVSPNVDRVMGVPIEDVRQSVRALGRAAYKSKDKISFEDLRQMTAGQTIGPMEARRVNPHTKEEKWYRETLYDVQIQDKERIIVYISDRTDEQKIQDTLTESLEEVQVANKAKSTFLSSMSHDIRTPMNAIMGMITLIQEDAGDPERVLEYTHRMDAASHHLLELINNVLDMNKIESGNITLSIGELNLATLVENVKAIILPQAKARNQTFKLWAADLTSEHLLGDETRISQILINILSNAVKYTQEGGLIEFTVKELPAVLNNYSRIRFVVKDNGQGISEEYQKVMFDPFTREQNSVTNKIQGTGLGMAITKSLVELMGGTISVESRLGEGSTFTVELDLRNQDQQADVNFWQNHKLARMIVADDDPDARVNVVHAMRNTGVEVHQAENGEEAIRIIREAREAGNPYDLILLDWRMPGLDGMETARLIRKNYPVKIPILFFTGYDWSDIEEEAREIGISHFLPKPFFMSTFKEAIRKVMTDHKAQNTAPKGESVLAGLHVLVAEDIEVNRLILGKILSTRGATCEMAENGQEAVDKFNASQPGQYDLIFMDIQMPVMNGYDAARAIRASDHPSARSVAIVAMTANAFADDVREALDSGMDGHVSKPIVMDQMEATLRKVMEGRGKDGGA